MFAVIKTGGKQYRVVAGQLVRFEKIIGNVGDRIEFNDVLMVGKDDSATIGVPVVSGASVVAEIVEQGRARKVIAFKKRRRQNSKRTRGHRQEITVLRVLEILMSGLKSKISGTKSDTKPKEVTKKSVEKKSAAVKKIKSAVSPEKTVPGSAEKKAASRKAAAVTSDSKKN